MPNRHTHTRVGPKSARKHLLKRSLLPTQQKAAQNSSTAFSQAVAACIPSRSNVPVQVWLLDPPSSSPIDPCRDAKVWHRLGNQPTLSSRPVKTAFQFDSSHPRPPASHIWRRCLPDTLSRVVLKRVGLRSMDTSAPVKNPSRGNKSLKWKGINEIICDSPPAASGSPFDAGWQASCDRAS